MRALIGFLMMMLTVSGCGSSSSPTSASRLPGPTTLRGTVFDTALRAVSGAKIEILDGPQTEASVTTDASGRFTVIGTFNSGTRFRTTKDGFLPATNTYLGTTCGACGFDVYLATDAPPLDLAGDYALTLVADSACTNLPNVALRRTYAAKIVPMAASELPVKTSFRVTLVGGSFLFQDHYNFVIRSAGDFLKFSVESLVEQIADGAVEFGGSGEASVGASTVSTFTAPFDGQVDYCEPSGSSAVCAHTRCASENHRLILERR